jgi:hypothetical protein
LRRAELTRREKFVLYDPLRSSIERDVDAGERST